MNGYSPFFLGGVEIICGPMFSGKTEELIRRVRLAQIARQKVQVFKSVLEDRYGQKDVVSHSNATIQAIPVEQAWDILNKLKDSTRVVGIDEVHLFDDSILGITTKFVKRGLRVICAGLDQNVLGVPYNSTAQLLALADEVDKVQAVCSICGSPASKTYCSFDESQQVVLGDKASVLPGQNREDMELFEARCNTHYYDTVS